MDVNEILFIIDKDEQLLFDGTYFKEASADKIKGYFGASALNSSLVRTHGFKLPKTISQEKIEVQAEIKMFDEAGLDSDTDFEIVSSVIEIDGSDDNYIETYAIENSILENNLSSVAKKNSRIDLIFPSFLSYSALYEFDLLDKKHDLFIHFDDDEAYAVMCKNGRYIASRNISSLNYIAKKIELDVDETRELLIARGVKSELYTSDEFMLMDKLQDEMRKVVERVSHTISHKRSLFGLEGISEVNRIFIDFEGADIPGFLDLFSDYGYGESTKEKLEVFKDIEVGKKHFALSALYALGVAQEKYTAPNLTIYEKKPPFITTHTGHFSILLLSSVILASIYPIYATLTLDKLNLREAKLQSDLARVQKTTKRLQVKLKSARKERDKLSKNKKEAISRINSYGYMLDTLEKFDSDIMVRQKMMKDVNIAMKKYKLSSKQLNWDTNNSMNVQIITKDAARDRIAEFMKELLIEGYAHVQTNKVEKNKTYYESFVEIHR